MQRPFIEAFSVVGRIRSRVNSNYKFNPDEKKHSSALGRLFLLLITFVAVSPVAAEGLSDGFRGLRWGSEPLKGMVEVQEKANMQGYVRLDEDLMVLKRQAFMISYYYYGGGLCRVEVGWAFQEQNALDQILGGLKSAWGKPATEKILQGLYNVEWISKSGITSGTFLAIDDTRTPKDDYLITLIVEGRECAGSAKERRGL